MSEKLGIGATFPNLSINLVVGGTLELPSGLNSKYGVVLFYRGHWWPYCRRQLVGFSNLLPELSAVGAKVVAASVDSLDNAKIVADEVGFPIGYGVTREMADRLGAWWQSQRNIIQPSEFVLDQDGKVAASSYSDGPIGRMDAADVLKLIKFYEARKK